MARRSARIGSRSSSTPQPTKSARLSHFDAEHGPRTVPAKLAALREIDDIPGSFPQSPTEMVSDTPSKRARTATPQRASAIAPPKEEMHPQAHHRTSLEKHDDARWLGFSNVERVEPAKVAATIPTLQRTPSKASGRINADPPAFQFTFQREQSLDLSPVARKLMEENRMEAMRVKEQMKSDASMALTPGPSQRPIATPKSGRGRFSDVHKEQFHKMESIAGHASAYRKDPARADQMTSLLPSAAKSLKRSPAKAELDAIAATPSKTPRAVVVNSSSADEDTSPRKRARFDGPAPSPSPLRSILKQKTPSRLPALRTPKSSIRHIPSASVCKIPAPPSAAQPPCATSTLLSKSPARAQIFPSQASATPSTLLSRTPIKPSTFKVAAAEHNPSPSPVRSVAKSSTREHTSSSIVFTPLLAQTPTKPVSAIFGIPQTAGNLESRFSMLRATPTKSILRTPQRLYSDDPAKVAAGTHLATPPQVPGRQIFRRAPATAPVRKHVDFSSSTKAREASKKQGIDKIFTAGPAQSAQASSAPFVFTPITYPSLDSTAPAESQSAPRRRQSSGPSDFTFRAGHEIVFASSTAITKPRPASQSPAGFTIRAVIDDSRDAAAAAKSSKKRKLAFEDAQIAASVQQSPTLSLGSKKRKFDFENEAAEHDAEGMSTADKENTPAEADGRPSKRMKAAPKSPAAVISRRAVSVPAQGKPPVKARTTLGVKPKVQVGKGPVKKLDAKKKAGSTISIARLNALAQPKKRD